jgi:hypothetical protein
VRAPPPHSVAFFALAALAAAVLLVAARGGTVEAAPAAPTFHIDDRVTVRESTRPDATVCLVHLHGNEENARAVMLDLAPKSCANAMWLDDALLHAPFADDRIPVPSSASETHACSVNPNRIFTPAGFAVRIANDCDDDAVARAELRRWVDAVFLPALARCRGGARALPVIAFHNNSRLTAQEMDTARADVVTGREHDILFVTDAHDFVALSALHQFTVAQQNAPPADDGSLSVLLQRERYLNVESQIAPANLAVNRAMGIAALHVLHGEQCPASPAPPRTGADAAKAPPPSHAAADAPPPSR